MATIERDGIRLRGAFSWRSRLVRFDDLEAIEDGRALLRGGGSVRLPPEVAAEASRILAGPPLPADLKEAGRSFAAFLSGPHGPRRAARGLLDLAAGLGASDVHLEPDVASARIRVRLAGELSPLCEIPGEPARALVAALKGLAGCLPYRLDVPQEGRVPRQGVCADVRASFVPAAFGERAALRLFGRLFALDELGFGSETLASLHRGLEARTGLFVVAGGTGAGKTTTLYAALGHLARSRPCAHLSLEDPVEQRLRAAGIPVDQIELDPARGVTAEAMLVAALRQDVDVLAVGEIRTAAEARLALEAAHTGRLVLAGLHAGSCAEARQRLLDLGIEPRLLATTLRGVLHQRLETAACGCAGRPGCPECKGAGRRRVLLARLEDAERRLEVA